MNHIANPPIPYNGPIHGGVVPGKFIQIQGSTFHHSQRFAVNLLSGPMGDILLHVSPNFHEHHVIRNSVLSGSWGHHESHGHMPIHKGQPFSMSILVEPHAYKIQFNGMHFAEFHHRSPYTRVTHIAVEGDVMISSISFDMGPGHMGGMHGGVHGGMPMGGHGGMPVGGHGGMPVGGHVGMPVGGHGGMHGGAYPPGVHASGHYPHQSSPGYPTQPGYPTSGPGYPTQSGYPSQQTPYPHSPTSYHKGTMLDKAGALVAGALGTTAVAGVLGKKFHPSSSHLYPGQTHNTFPGQQAFLPHNKSGGLLNKAGATVAGVLGTAGVMSVLGGTGVPGHALTKKELKKQRKAQKKALKYGLGGAALGAGAYGAYSLHKHHKHGHHGHHKSSSSSSSSSSSD